MRTSVKRLMLGGAATLGLLAAVPATPAFAIDQVGCCNRTDFVKLDIDFGTGLGTNTCFANAGDRGVDIGGVYNISAGNNKVTVNWESGGTYHTETLGFWQGIGFSGTVRVYEIRIW